MMMMIMIMTMTMLLMMIVTIIMMPLIWWRYDDGNCVVINLPTYLPTCLPTYLPTHLPTHPSIYLPIYLPTYPSTYLAYLPRLTTYSPLLLAIAISSSTGRIWSRLNFYNCTYKWIDSRRMHSKQVYLRLLKWYIHTCTSINSTPSLGYFGTANRIIQKDDIILR